MSDKLSRYQGIWRPTSFSPKVEGRYLCALKATNRKPPREEIFFWTRKFGWANRYITHWMELPENPND